MKKQWLILILIALYLPLFALDLDKDTQPKSIDLTQNEREWLRAHPIIHIAIDPSWAPIEYLDKQGNYQGLAADYLALISQKLGIRFVPNTNGVWKDSIRLMEQHRLDMYSCAVKIPGREKYVTFTTPYLNFRMVIATGDNVGYLNSIHDLKGKTIAVARGYLPQEILKHYYPFIKRLEVDTVTEGLDVVMTGKAFAFIDNTAAITYAIKQEGYSNIKISGELPYRFELAMGIRNDWPILATIMEKALASITPQERDAIYNRHIKIEYTQQFTWSGILKIVLPLTILLLLLLYYTRKLRTINQDYKMTLESLKRTQSDLEAANTKLQTLSSTDALTTLANRYRLNEALQHAVNRAKRYRRALSVILIDLDFFKNVNDTYGHHAGDEVLRKTADLLRQNCRESDTVGRWGGEEFLIICPETTKEDAIILAEKLRSIFAEETMFPSYTQTASFGVSAYDDDTPETLVIHADEALYIAKTSGRNRVCVN
ncbi:MAG: diguanylate cyclase [Sulfuricurvum sp.]|uniref:transporter substrate-binding domain-containing diguanylate cyclase n=1 Tax=Sulfuricurvum sp. TaxID=2025608 RepID=UPI0026054160|nr:diguanylate cyclase [Sulfuricurvum sp.]MDD5118561.1 diguanylate cyclase [Sulfuricurvum sp.]